MAVAVICGTTAPYPGDHGANYLLWLWNRSLEAKAIHLELEQVLSNTVEPSPTYHDIASAYLLSSKD